MNSENKGQFWLKLALCIPPPHTVPKVWFQAHPCHTDTHLVPWGRCPLALHPGSTACLPGSTQHSSHQPPPPSCASARKRPTPVCQRQSLLQHGGKSALGDISHCGTTHGEICVRSQHGAAACTQHSSTRLTALAPPSHLLYIQPSGPGQTALRKP